MSSRSIDSHPLILWLGLPMSESCPSTVEPTTDEAGAYRDYAILMISQISCTPKELREWWVTEIGQAPEAKPGWGKRRVPPGRARIDYRLSPMDCHLIERACKRRIAELEAKAADYDRDWA